MTSEGRWAILNAARGEVLRWAHERGIPLARIEFVVPFITSNPDLGAWFFYETDAQLRDPEAGAWSEGLIATLASALREFGETPGGRLRLPRERGAQR